MRDLEEGIKLEKGEKGGVMTCASQLASVYVLHLPNGARAGHAAPFSRLSARKITTTKIHGNRYEIDIKYRENRSQSGKYEYTEYESE